MYLLAQYQMYDIDLVFEDDSSKIVRGSKVRE